MADEYKNDILYVPHAEPDRDYRSEGEFSPEEREVVPIMPDPEPVPDDTPGKVAEDLKEVSEIIQGLPEELHFLRPSIDRLRERIEVVWPDGKQPPENPPVYTPIPKKPFVPIIRTVPTPDSPDVPKVPNGIPNLVPINIKMQAPKSVLKLVQDGYKTDTIRLTQYYLQQLQLIMQKYFQQMIAAMHDCHLDDIDNLTRDFDGNFVKIPAGQNLEHLRDYICRSQTARKQKSMLFRKTHSVDNTLVHMRAWHATAKEQERYYSEKYVDSGTYSSSHANSLLRESREMYDKAYDSALYNMYKYLNSATLLTNDILEATAKEAQAKAQLINKGVDIFAFDQEEAATRAGGVAGNSGQAGDGSGSGFDSAPSTTSSSGSSTTQPTDATSGGSSGDSPKSTEGASPSGGSTAGNTPTSNEGNTPNTNASSIGNLASSFIGDSNKKARETTMGALSDLGILFGGSGIGLPFGKIDLGSINAGLDSLGIKIGNGKISDIINKSNESLEKIGNIAQKITSGIEAIPTGAKVIGDLLNNNKASGKKKEETKTTASPQNTDTSTQPSGVVAPSKYDKPAKTRFVLDEPKSSGEYISDNVIRPGDSIAVREAKTKAQEAVAKKMSQA